MKGILNFCKIEHEKIEKKYEGYLESKIGARDEVLSQFRKFKCTLHRHMSLEEDVLFDFFERQTGLKDIGPAYVMRQEHEKIRGLLKVIQNEIEFGERLTGNDEALLMSFFHDHGMREDEMLTAVMEMVTDGEAKAIVSDMENFSKGCCSKCVG